jgi:LysR family transcriptional regulator, glycine cleavage system transcriptional activator
MKQAPPHPIRIPPLNALRAFESAARLLSFKQAAAELHVTPTAVSHHIKQLESLVGQRLFERRARSIELTDAGRRLFPALRDGFEQIARAVAALGSEGETLTVSVTSAFASKILVPHLHAFQALHPTIRLRIDAREALSDLRKAEADVAVRYSDDRPIPFQSTTLFSDRFIAVAAPSLLRERRQLTAWDLLQLQTLSYVWRSATLRGPTWSDFMVLAGVGPHDPGRCHVFSEEGHAIQAAIEGAGVGLLSSALVARDLVEGRLVQAHPLSLPGFTFRAVFLADHPRLASIQKLTRWLSGLAASVQWSDGSGLAPGRSD